MSSFFRETGFLPVLEKQCSGPFYLRGTGVGTSFTAIIPLHALPLRIHLLIYTMTVKATIPTFRFLYRSWVLITVF